ncbi:MAG: carotenoid oxygenase family protein [Chroococcales cyanobacterium]
MVTTKSVKGWSKSVLSPAQEFALTPLPVLSGRLPEGLRGSLYRNGPGRLKRRKKSVGHWFDGDGAVLAVHFQDEEAKGVYRYVQTEGFQKEEKAGTFFFPNYGMTAPGGVWNNWIRPVKNAANTSVLALPDQLLALWEGGHPHALNLETLETKGIEHLSLKSEERFSAHPKVDPKTGEFFNFGITLGLNAVLKVYKYDANGKLLKKGSQRLKGLPLIHDFVLAGPYLVFFVSPVRVNLFSAGLGVKSYSEAIAWKPEEGTQVFVFDRETLRLISRGETDSWFQWHFANGCVDSDGLVSVEMVAYDDFRTNQYLQEVATGSTKTIAKGMLSQVKLDPQTGKVIRRENVCDSSCEFPIVAPNQVGESWRYTYMGVHRDDREIGQELLGAIASFDRETGNVAIADCGKNRYPSEPIYVPNQQNLNQGWLITVVYDGNNHTSEVWLYDSQQLENEPICRLGLPRVVPPSFHGTWKPSLNS